MHASIIFFKENKHEIENWIKITTLLTRSSSQRKGNSGCLWIPKLFSTCITQQHDTFSHGALHGFPHQGTTWAQKGRLKMIQMMQIDDIDDAKSSYSQILRTSLNNTWAYFNMLWMLLEWMVFPHWHNNVGTKNRNNSSDVRQLKLPIHSKVPFREKKKIISGN